MRESSGPNRATFATMRRRGHGFALAVVALTGGFALASCGSDDEAGGTTETTTTETATQTTTETQTTTQQPPVAKPTEVRVRIVGGAPQGAIVRKSVNEGDRVVVIVTSDVSDHVHVHGYDLFGDVVPGKRVRIAFRARIPGRFLIELEDRHAQIAELTVEP
jgi:FtsP/CotA-like multicopper oxidase with cupredoxin domain